MTQMSDSDQGQSRDRETGRVRASVLRLASNVCFGIALGMLGYYGVTDLVMRFEQSALQDAAPRGFYERAVESEDPFDWDGWAQEDESYWGDLAEGRPFLRIVSEKMGLDAIVVKGVQPADLKRGPGWIPYTDLPGPTGNCGISGHRTTYGAPFRRLDRLSPGDEVMLYSPFRRYTYRVTRSFTVTPDRVDVVATTEDPTLTLTACHPPYSARLRLIVQAELTEVRRLAGSAGGEVDQ